MNYSVILAFKKLNFKAKAKDFIACTKVLPLAFLLSLAHLPNLSAEETPTLKWDLETDESTGEQKVVLQGAAPKRKLEVPKTMSTTTEVSEPVVSTTPQTTTKVPKSAEAPKTPSMPAVSEPVKAARTSEIPKAPKPVESELAEELAEETETKVIIVRPEGFSPARPARRVKPTVPEKPAVSAKAEKPKERRRIIPKREMKPKGPNLYFENFFMTSDQRLAYDTVEVDQFVFAKTPNRKRRTNFSIVTRFGKGILQSQFIEGLSTEKDVKRWVEGKVQSTKVGSVEVRKIDVPVAEGKTKPYFYVGNKSFDSLKTAQAQIAQVQSLVKAQGGDFDEMVQQVKTYYRVPEKKAAEEISKAQYQKEEELVLKWLDQLDIGEKLWGPFMGTPAGEPIIWQSFGETSWRRTNLADLGYRDQVGFWTNRLVFKGIRAPLNTIDPYVQATIAMESNGVDFADTLILGAGLEWRPFERNAFLQNYRPWGGIPLLSWIRNYRFFVAYFDRKNLKDEIDASDNHNLIAGVDIFYEWGVELPELLEPEPQTFADYVREYVWGEYFGLYAFDMTNFGPEDDFDAWIFNSSVTLGVRLPGIPLPPNPINHELVLMPYMRFEHVNNTQFSFPFQNRYFVATGVRWMPFRNYRYKENEWLSKTKVFAEFVGVGKTQHARVTGEEVPHAVRWDLRFGVNISSRRF